MTITQLSNAGNQAYSYVSEAEANAFLDLSIQYATAWNAAEDANKVRALISATRRIDEFQFLGEPAADPQPLKFPRDDFIDNDGVEHKSGELPVAIEEATMYLAADLLANPTNATRQSTQKQAGVKSKTVKAGSASTSTSYFQNVSQISVETNSDLETGIEHVDKLLAPFLAGGGDSADLAGGCAFGTGGERFDVDAYGVTRG